MSSLEIVTEADLADITEDVTNDGPACQVMRGLIQCERDHGHTGRHAAYIPAGHVALTGSAPAHPPVRWS